MLGTALNALGILLGGSAGLLRKQGPAPSTESFWKVALGVFTVFYGLKLSWLSVKGSPGQVLKQLLITIIALMLGRWTGWLLRLQRISNSMGQRARARIEVPASDSGNPAEGFQVCAVLFCAAPLGIVGAVADGLSAYAYPLGIKAVMDGLAAMGLARLFGWGTLLAALPVLAMQGSISLICMEWVGPWLQRHGLVDSVNAAGGLVIFSVALVILQLKRIALADYLPSLLYAPLITWLWR